MATSETRMGSTCPTNEKGIKRKVLVRSWIARESERKREEAGSLYIDAVDGVREICDAKNNRWAKRKMQLRARRQTEAIAIDPEEGSPESRSRGGREKKG